MSAKLKIVPTAPTTEQLCRETVRELDKAQAVIDRLKPLAIELGRDLIRERYPDEKEFMRPDLARVRRELMR